MVNELDGLGVSLAFSADKNLQVNYLGSYALVSGADNVRQAVELRLHTPLGALALHPEYGNRLFAIVSDPLQDDFPVKAELAVRECLAGETRITVKSIGVNVLREKRTAQIMIRYSVNEDRDITETMLEVPYGV
ncbi:GPW/gp25 family protein [Desulfitobacterium chlororespirans]|uniref:IraD/Gp25-like domain-containing protein n=1 Tax=Desulfitobacterium chlororespirans DSM 11544 TaxID=1121395 RepID=A0A1M7TQV3_9FIRM|nr:GPW/gp25 family protein [Desulfitobacterium chlororespirans]SHN73117.1 hypothetical protein SAMN02745215_02409 [Desulfitobacterium chlororespirans DSM 11544]